MHASLGRPSDPIVMTARHFANLRTELDVFGEPLAEPVEPFRHLFARAPREVLRTRVHLDAGEDPLLLERPREGHPVRRRLPKRLVEEDHAAQGLPAARRGDEELAPDPAVLLGRFEPDGVETAPDRGRALVGGEDPLSARHHRVRDALETRLVHHSDPPLLNPARSTGSSVPGPPPAPPPRGASGLPATPERPRRPSRSATPPADTPNVSMAARVSPPPAIENPALAATRLREPRRPRRERPVLEDPHRPVPDDRTCLADDPGEMSGALGTDVEDHVRRTHLAGRLHHPPSHPRRASPRPPRRRGARSRTLPRRPGREAPPRTGPARRRRARTRPGAPPRRERCWRSPRPRPADRPCRRGSPAARSCPPPWRPPTTATTGRAGRWRACPSASSSAERSGPAQALGAWRTTPAVDAWARWAVPNASITKTSQVAAIRRASASSFSVSPARKRTFSASASFPGAGAGPSSGHPRRNRDRPAETEPFPEPRRDRDHGERGVEPSPPPAGRGGRPRSPPRRPRGPARRSAGTPGCGPRWRPSRPRVER